MWKMVKDFLCEIIIKKKTRKKLHKITWHDTDWHPMLCAIYQTDDLNGKVLESNQYYPSIFHETQ